MGPPTNEAENRTENDTDQSLDDDSDSDLEGLQEDIARFDESVRSFLATHRGPTEASSGESGVSHNDLPRPPRGPSRGRGARGPRKAAKPRGDITARLSRVNQAFLAGDYPRAMDLAFEVIRINAETHQAWTALASIFGEQGESSRALSAMVYAAHLRPKDVYGWLRCADFALSHLEDDETTNLKTARLCYSAAIRANPDHIEARLGKAHVCQRQGHLAAAITEYKIVLRHRPRDLDIIRRLAEVCLDNRHAPATALPAIAAYREYLDHEITAQITPDLETRWHDAGIYVELLAAAERYQDAIYELKRLGRWLAGRTDQAYWDKWQDDDREWDADGERRAAVHEHAAVGAGDRFGDALPAEFRLRLALYRLKLGNFPEASRHLSWLAPSEPYLEHLVAEFPFLVYDMALELSQSGQEALAIPYLLLLSSSTEEPDAAVSLALGQCYLAIGDKALAEESFLSAIDADADNVDARIHLANMYEEARENEEALILAVEAMALKDARGAQKTSDDIGHRRPVSDSRGPRRQRPARSGKSREPGTHTKPAVPRRYRPKRLGGTDQRLRDEEARAIKLSQQYETVRSLKQSIGSGDRSLVPQWLASSQELVDDFRSLKKFYTWDKYLRFLAPNPTTSEAASHDESGTELSQMYQRLSSRTLLPGDEVQDPNGRTDSALNSHEGISYDDWLELFLDYAIGLAIHYRRDDSYGICEAARDSSAFSSPEHNFTVHVAWSVCAILTCDEESCVRISRHLMTEDAMSDSCRMFSLLSTLCQSPVSWYTSGPAQKYILRQIKQIDAKNGVDLVHKDGEVKQVKRDGAQPGLDVCIIMLYGHILFSSASYTSALSYFLRARSIDPDNAMVNLSLGLAYVHAAMKRQATNRQYLLLQGQSFMMRYMEIDERAHDGSHRMEVLYNLGRLYQLLGIHDLAHHFYEQALANDGDDEDSRNLRVLICSNEVMSSLAVRNYGRALALMKQGLRL